MLSYTFKLILSLVMKKYLQVKEEILADISSGRLKVGDQLPIREELLKKHLVSHATLNRAINELTRTGQLKAYRSRGTFVAEKTEKLKIALVSNFEITATQPEHRYFLQWQESLRHVIISLSRGEIDFLDSKKAEKSFSVFSEYDAVIWIMPSNKMLKELGRLKHKVIVVNRYGKNLSFVSTNHHQAQYDMTEHFIKKFGEDCYLVYLDIEDDEFICSERREGFVKACDRYEKFYRMVKMGQIFEENVDRLMKLELRPDKKNVIISPSHVTTGIVFRMAYLRGLRIEEDFFYSDFDNANSLEITGIKIPSILQDYNLMGEEVVKIANNIAEGPVQCFIPHRLVNL